MAKLAISGGRPLSKTGLKANWPEVDAKDVQAMTRVVKSGSWWRYGGTGEVEKFEKAYASFHDAKYCLSIANGTVAIEAALHAVGMKPGDEVIVPAVTFIATASAVMLARGKPVFADVLPETCQLDPDEIERRMSPRTTGIVVVHYGGYPADMDRIKRVARKHKLFVIEDCAHAQATEWRGRKVGAISDAGTFSFQMSKSLTSGEGGAVITDSSKVYEAAYAYHHIGRTLWAKKYEHESVGPNYRVTEFQGAILNTQLAKLTRQTRTRMRTAKLIAKRIKDIPGLEPLVEDPRITQRGYYFCILRFNEEIWGVKRDTFVSAMQAEGVKSLGVGYGCPVYHLPVFRKNVFDVTGFPVVDREAFGAPYDYRDVCCPDSEWISYHEHLTLPNHSLLDPANADVLGKAAEKLWQNREELLTFEKRSTAAKRSNSKRAKKKKR